jgi:hypothetical protein
MINITIINTNYVIIFIVTSWTLYHFSPRNSASATPQPVGISSAKDVLHSYPQSLQQSNISRIGQHKDTPDTLSFVQIIPN